MNKVLVIGASGLIGSQIVAQLQASHEVISASPSNAEYPIDISDPASVEALFNKTGSVHAIICVGGMARFMPWDSASSEDWDFALKNKLMGQINILRKGLPHVEDGGAVVLTSGLLAHYPIPGSSMVSTVNAAIEAAIKAVATELGDHVRVGAVSPGWVKETMEAMGLESSPGLPAADVAAQYVDFLKTGTNGEVRRAAKG